jgi:hypothetical protein
LTNRISSAPDRPRFGERSVRRGAGSGFGLTNGLIGGGVLIAKAAQTTVNVVNAGNAVVSGDAQINSIANEHVGTWNPAVAAVRSTTLEVSGLIHWNDDPTGSAAQSLGSQLPAQPIPVPSGG